MQYFGVLSPGREMDVTHQIAGIYLCLLHSTEKTILLSIKMGKKFIFAAQQKILVRTGVAQQCSMNKTNYWQIIAHAR